MSKAKQPRHFIMLVWAFGALGLISFGLVPNLAPLPEGGDKILHASAFFALMIGPAYFMPRVGMMVFSALFLVFCGALLEFLQGFIPERESSLADLCSDAVGIAAGFWFGFFLRKSELFKFLPLKERFIR